MNAVTESTVEEAALGWFAELGTRYGRRNLRSMPAGAMRVGTAGRLVGAAG